MGSKAWNDVLSDFLLRIKPKNTLQYIYEMISGLEQQILWIYKYFKPDILKNVSKGR